MGFRVLRNAFEIRRREHWERSSVIGPGSTAPPARQLTESERSSRFPDSSYELRSINELTRRMPALRGSDMFI